MKLTTLEKAVLFLAAGLLLLAYLSFRQGQSRLGGCWIFGAFGCFVMLYAAHGGNKKK